MSTKNNNIFKFKPEVEEDIIISHPDLTGKAEHSFEIRKKIFDEKYSRQILVNKITHEIYFEECLKEKRKKIMEKELEALSAFDKFSGKFNWLTDDEERALFVEHYVSEIRLEVDKKQRCESWVKEHFF